MTMFIDTPWDEVEQRIRDVVAEELIDPEGGTAAHDWGSDMADRISRRVMQALDGGDYERDEHGLRRVADG